MLTRLEWKGNAYKRRVLHVLQNMQLGTLSSDIEIRITAVNFLVE
jgi:hypothetical protein